MHTAADIDRCFQLFKWYRRTGVVPLGDQVERAAGRSGQVQRDTLARKIRVQAALRPVPDVSTIAKVLS
jgi:hypothetical protein